MRLVLIVCLLALVVGAAYAQQAPQPASVALDLSNVDIAQAFATLSEKGNVSIMGDTTVKGAVSCSLSGVTAEQALDTICKMNKLEWYKTYASVGADEKATASKLFKLLDALKELGGSAVICSDPKTQTQTVFIPNAGAKTLDASAVATDMKLKAIYIVRAIPDPAAAKPKDAPKAIAGNPANTDPKTAAGQLVGYLQQMPMEQRFQTMNEMRQQFHDSMTPEQHDQMRQYMQQQGWGRGGGGNRGPGGPGGPGGQGGQNNGQGGGGHKRDGQ